LWLPGPGLRVAEALGEDVAVSTKPSGLRVVQSVRVDKRRCP
jgi:hypothetical protein